MGKIHMSSHSNLFTHRNISMVVSILHLIKVVGSFKGVHRNGNLGKGRRDGDRW